MNREACIAEHKSLCEQLKAIELKVPHCSEYKTNELYELAMWTFHAAKSEIKADMDKLLNKYHISPACTDEDAAEFDEAYQD